MGKIFCMLALVGCLFSISIAQTHHRSIFAVDSTIGSTGFIQCLGGGPTGIPGAEYGLVGNLNVFDSAFVTTRYMYFLTANNLGEPQRLMLYTDPLVTALGPRSFAFSPDGMGNVYHAMGSRGKQVVLRTDTSGAVHWAIEYHHHELIDLAVADTMVYLMGQDESVAGAHDFSLVRTDSAGRGYLGMMYGTVNEDLPEDMVMAGGHLVMAGRFYVNNAYQAEVVKADRELGQVWGHSYASQGIDLSCKAITAANGGYLIAGNAPGTLFDSIWVAQLDSMGQPQWAALIGLDSTNAVELTDISAVDGGTILVGRYLAALYHRNFALKLGPSGQLLWAKTYGSPALHDDEEFDAVAATQGGAEFLASGSRLVEENFIYDYSIFSVTASAADGSLDCDSMLTFGSRAFTISISGSTSTQGFTAGTPISIVHTSAQAYLLDRCGIIISNEAPISPSSISFPNPVTDRLPITVRLSEAETAATLTLTSLWGQELQRSTLPSGQSQVEWNLGSLPVGIYLLRLQPQGQPSTTRRVVVAR